ncbi:MAG: GNAT family N-acetyltransferase [Chloroflexota bacterium]
MTHDIRLVREDEMAAWFECLTTTFLERPDVPLIASQIAPHWELDRVWGAFDGTVVGTFRTFATEVTVPGLATVPATALSAVTVRATHRRRGILRAMIAAEHAAARERGEALAILYAAEAGIYGRFGYGTAVTACEWALDVRSTAFFGPPDADIEFLPADESTAGLMREVHERYRLGRVGEIRRRPVSFAWSLELIKVAWGEAWKGWVAVHRDTEGTPDGFVRYSADPKWEDGQPRAVIKIQDLVATSPAAYRALWRFLAETDLVATVKAERGALSDDLPWLLTNRRAADATGVGDGLWVHLLDVPTALAARTYERPGDLVIEVVDAERDPKPVRVHLEAGPDGAACSPTKRSADLTIHAGALGAAYLGGSPFDLAAIGAGFDEHRPGALNEATALFRTIEEPRCTTFF